MTPTECSTALSASNGAIDMKGVVPGADSSAPKVPEFDFKAYSNEDALVEDVIKGMKVAGGCIVRNLIDPAALDKIEGEVFPLLENAQPWNG